tara:strand:+ start:1985 stop:5896 length:3912 start_codon:yes stop_codon:yes gene_type:complete
MGDFKGSSTNVTTINATLVTADDLEVDSTTLSVDADNNKVGIGLTSPKTKLTVEGTLTLKEQANAESDTAAYGQLWVKSDTPNDLYFTNDAGNDVRITNGSSLAAAPGASVAADDINVGDNSVSISGGSGHSLTLNATAATAQLKTTTSGEVDITSAANIDINATTGIAIDGTTISINGTDDVNLTVTSSTAGEDLTIQQIGANDSSIIITAAGTGADAVSIDATAGSMQIGSSLADEKTLTVGNTSSTYAQLIPHGTAASEKILVKNTSGTADDAIKIESTAGGVTILAGNDSLHIDADGTDADAINIDSAGGIDIDASGDTTLDTTSFTVTSDTVTFTSGNANDPLVTIQNTAADATAPRLKFNKNRSGDAQDGDDVGDIQFWSYDDGTPSVQQYAGILAEVHDATSNEESGKLTLQVASHDGGVESGIVLTGGSVDAEVDVTVGNGSASIVTVPGNIDLAGDIDVDGTANLDAVDIDGNVQLDGTFTLGSSTNGQDFILHSSTANEGVIYDASQDELALLLTTKLKFHDVGGGEEIFASANGHLEVNSGTTLDMTAPTIDLNASTTLHIETPTAIITSTTSTKPTLELRNVLDGDEEAGPQLTFSKFPDGAQTGEKDDVALGSLLFKGLDGGNNDTTYGQITVHSSDKSSGDEGGEFRFSVMNGGTGGAASLTEIFTIGGEDVNGSTPCEVIVNEASVDCDFRVESGDEEYMLFVDAGNNRVSIGDSTDAPAATLEITNNASAGAFNVPLTQFNSNDIDQIAIDVNAANTTANVLDITANALTSGKAIFIDHNDTATANVSPVGIHIDFDKSGVVGDGATSTFTGLDIDLNDAATNHANADVTQTGATIAVATTNAQGTTLNLGLQVSTTGADENFQIALMDDNAKIGFGADTDIILTHDPDRGLILTQGTDTTEEPVFTIKNTGNLASGGGIEFIADNDAGEGDGDVLGYLSFKGDDSGNNATQYAKLSVLSSDVTNNDEGGQFKFEVMANDGGNTNNHALTPALNIVGGLAANAEVVVNDGGVDLNFRVEGDTDTHLLFVDAVNDRVSVGVSTDAPAAILEVAGDSSSGAPAFKVTNADVDVTGVEFVLSNTTAIGFDIAASNTTTEAVKITADGLTSGDALSINSNSSDNTARSLMKMHNNHASATGVSMIEVVQDSTGPILDVSYGSVGSALQLKVRETTHTCGTDNNNDEIAAFFTAGMIPIALGIRVTTTISNNAYISKLGTINDDDSFGIFPDGTLEEAGDNLATSYQPANATGENTKFFTGDHELRITYNATPGAGALRLVLYYYEITPPTS